MFCSLDLNRKNINRVSFSSMAAFDLANSLSQAISDNLLPELGMNTKYAR